METSRWLVLCLACVLCFTSISADTGRELLKSKKELADESREEDALEAYYLQQATLNKEQEALLRFGEEEAVSVVKKVDGASTNKQISVFSDLWENAKGVAIVKSLAILIEAYPKKTEHFYEVNSAAMDKAESNGYTFKVSEAVYNALAVTDGALDHYHLLDALLYRMDQLEEEKKGSGCQYIQFLFTDAESWAIDDGRTQNFFRGFENEDYLPLTECFLEECKGTAAECCADEDAISSGLCGCEVVNKKEGTLQCEHNLFWTAPRTIWLCSTQDCAPDQKCLCSKSSSKKAKKTKKGSKSDKEEEESKKKSSKEDEEEEKSSKKSKKSSKEEEEDSKESTKKSSKGKEEEETKKSKKSSKEEEEEEKSSKKSKKSSKVEEEEETKKSKKDSKKAEDGESNEVSESKESSKKYKKAKGKVAS